ncbi:F-box protein At5g03100-like [Miscanthus floridulus]|uniref:F-box protein At5g03100-like n=1 Tax=Miscanthus floridulus TaxID=154761 RepID=UPI003458B8E5
MDSQTLPMEPPAIPLGGAEDLISGLPDDLLHIILIRLPSAAAAARISVLSRRWRGVWAHMPELVLGGSPAPAPATTPSALLDSIDAALNSSAAPTLRSLNIDVSGFDRCDIPAHRISPWLHFASHRIAGKLRFHLYLRNYAQSCRHVLRRIVLIICQRITVWMTSPLIHLKR